MPLHPHAVANAVADRVAKTGLAQGVQRGNIDLFTGVSGFRGGDCRVVMRINQRQRRTFLDNAPPGARVHLAVADAFLVPARAHDALALAGVKAQFGKDQRIGKDARVLGSQAEGREAFGNEGTQGIAVNTRH